MNRSSRIKSANNFWQRNVWPLVFPVNCLICHDEGEWLCPSCQKQLIISPKQICRICGKAGDDGLCAKCRRFTRLDGLIAPFAYHHIAVQAIIKEVKYRGHFDAWRSIVNQIRKEISLPANSWQIVPVPLSSDRQRQRGFNQSELLAQYIFPNQKINHPLRRHRSTISQTELDRKARLINVRGCFSIEPEVKVKDNILLVDDVVTTGATLREMARVLRQAGGKTIWAITVAHG